MIYLILNFNYMSSKLGKIIADFRTSLATKISIGGTTASLQSATDDDGNALPAGNYFFTLDGDNSQKEHFTCALSGTSLTALKSVSRQGVQTSGALREHRVGATVTITDFAHIKYINDLLDGTTDLNGSVPLKYDTDPTLSTGKHIATKKYVDDTVTGVVGTADSTTFGTTKLSSDPATPGQPVALNNEEVSTTSVADKVPKANTDGKVDSGFTASDDTDASLEAGTDGGLAVKVKTAGGVVRDSDGLSVDFSGVSLSVLKKSYSTGEDIAAGNALAIATGGNFDSITRTTKDSKFTMTTNAYWYAQTFISLGEAVNSVKLYTSDSGGDNNRTISVGIYATSAGLPTGSALGTGAVTIAATNSSTGAEQTATFATPIATTKGTLYAVVAYATNTNTAIAVHYAFTSTYSGGNSCSSTNSGSTWSAGVSTFYFIVNQSLVANKIYKASGVNNSQLANNFIGFADEAKTSGQDIISNIAGVDDNQTGLTVGAQYYLSDTPGAIVSSAGYYSKKVGMADTATSIYIKNDNI